MLWVMPEKELEPHVISHFAAISACEKGEQWEKVLVLLWEKLRTEANVISYSAAISACEQGEQWEKVLALLREKLRTISSRM